MKKILIYMSFLICLLSFVMAVQTPVFTSPASSGLTTQSNTQTLTASGCTAGYKYSIYSNLVLPNISVLSPNTVGTVTVTTATDGTYFYQALCGNNYLPINYSKLLHWISLDNSMSNYTSNKTNCSTGMQADMRNLTTANNITSKVNEGMSMDGKDQYINMSIVDLTSYSFTVSAWFKWNGAAANNMVVSLGNGTNTAYSIYITSTGTIATLAHNTTATVGPGFVALTPNVWHNALLIRTVAGNTVSMYLDNVYQGTSGTIGGNIPPVTQLMIGKENSVAAPYFFNGTVDEVLIYNNTFTVNQQTALYELNNNDTGYSVTGNWTYQRLTNEQTAAKTGCNSTKLIIFAGLALIAVAMIVLSAFGIVNIFNGHSDVGSLSAVAVGLIALAVVILLGYYIISTAGASICMA
jgi:hypothetical protein